ncbi:hypothetical protein Fmac_008439 [Flemingia macrophylla]|uniref:Uncharacterized protein n=1 Tax=Flemingia macrophylla TaxID=520843 RepID=A0ABD1MXG9_9FABA
MDGQAPIVPRKFLLDTEMVCSLSRPPKASYAQTTSRTCDVPNSQLPLPCRKGDKIVVTIPEEEYAESLSFIFTFFPRGQDALNETFKSEGGGSWRGRDDASRA